MPSWNIHTAHAERILEACIPKELGIEDANAFLFGNYVPDIYVGFMVPDASIHIDYCITHVADVAHIPVPDAERFWNQYIGRRAPATSTGMSLVVGAWAHIFADRFYNMRFREFLQTHDAPTGDELRRSKQADFDLYGRSLSIARHVQRTDELLEAARSFLPYSILPADVERAIAVASDIVRNGGKPPSRTPAAEASRTSYRLLDAEWMNETFELCNTHMVAWLQAWQALVADDAPCLAEDVRARQ